MHKDYKSFDILKSIPNRVLVELEHDSSLGVFDFPFTYAEGLENDKLVEFIDCVFYNTELLSPAGKYFEKHGVYTKFHPVYDKKEYDAFWDEEERRRKEGYTAPCLIVKRKDGTYCTQDLHITGEHYGYLNYAPIMRVERETLDKIGEMLRNGATDEELGELQGNKIKALPFFLDSDYYFFKAVELARKRGKHLVVAKARRKGYSYKNGWLAADKADLYRNSVTGLGAFHADSLYPGGTMTMANNYLQHIAGNTDWSKRRLIDKQDVIKFGFKRNDGLGIEEGFLSSIFAASFAPNNPGALRGKDCKFMLIEESGKNPILDKVLTSTLPTLRAGVITTGLMIVFGTGGGEDKQWEAFEDLFYFPSTEGFLAFNNIWDEDERGTECGFFVPSYMGKEGFFDIHGNSDVRGGISYELYQRELRKASNKASKLSDYIMEEPFNPKEAFSRSKTNIFPSVQIEEQLRKVKKDPAIKAITRSGILVRNNQGRVIFKDKIFLEGAALNDYHTPIFNFPLKKEDDPYGSVVIWEHPYRDRATGIIPEGLYRAEHDPFALPKDGKDVTGRDSLGATYIYKRVNNENGTDMGDKLVASFIGRPETTAQYNKILFDLLEYYNCILQYENDRGDIFAYAKQYDKLDWLADEPDLLFQKDVETKKTARKKGMSMNTARKEKGVVYLRDWLLTQRGVDKFGNIILNLHCIYDEALLLELLKFNFKGNFDRVSAMLIMMYDMKETIHNEIYKPRPVEANSNNIFDRELF